MRLMSLPFSILIPTLALIAGAASADPAIGVWKTEPDRKKLVSHIQISPCGDALCGKILRAFDPSGKQVQTPNIGKQLFWGVKPAGSGKYDGGTAQIPLIGKAKASMVLTGSKLKVIGCKAGICDSQIWSRL